MKLNLGKVIEIVEENIPSVGNRDSFSGLSFYNDSVFISIILESGDIAVLLKDINIQLSNFKVLDIPNIDEVGLSKEIITILNKYSKNEVVSRETVNGVGNYYGELEVLKVKLVDGTIEHYMGVGDNIGDIISRVIPHELYSSLFAFASQGD